MKSNLDTSNVSTLIVNLCNARIRQYIVKHRCWIPFVSKSDKVLWALRDYCKDPQNSSFFRAIKNTPYYDNGEFTALLKKFRDVL